MGRQRRMATAEAERVARAEVGEDGEGRGVGGASGLRATPFGNASSAFRGLPASASTTPSHSFRQMCRTFPPPPAQTKAEPRIRHPPSIAANPPGHQHCEEHTVVPPALCRPPPSRLIPGDRGWRRR